MLIRPVAEGDANVWIRMRARLWPDAKVDDLAADVRALLGGKPQTGLTAAFVAEGTAAMPLGFIELSVRAFSDGCDSMPVPHIEGWYVEPAVRNMGVGRQLMHAAEVWSRSHGFTELASDTEVHNIDSQHAHASCGFDEVDRLVKYRKALR